MSAESEYRVHLRRAARDGAQGGNSVTLSTRLIPNAERDKVLPSHCRPGHHQRPPRPAPGEYIEFVTGMRPGSLYAVDVNGTSIWTQFQRLRRAAARVGVKLSMHNVKDGVAEFYVELS